MKIRYSYVSNSSSSSFIIYGNKLIYDEAIKAIKDKSKNIMCVFEGAGTSGDCGDFVFTMTKDRFDLFKKYDVSLKDAKFYDVIKIWGTDIVDVKEPLTGGRLYEVSKDESSPWNDNADDKMFMKWLMRRA